MRSQILSLLGLMIISVQAYVPVAVGQEETDLNASIETSLLYRSETFSRMRMAGYPNQEIPGLSIVRITSVSERKVVGGRTQVKPKEDKFCLIGPMGEVHRSRYTYGGLNMSYHRTTFLDFDDRQELLTSRQAILSYLRKNPDAREELRAYETSSYRMDEVADVFPDDETDRGRISVRAQYFKLKDLINRVCR